MKEKFERVEKHLYRRKYRTAGGRVVDVVLCAVYRLEW
jgi:hypothetical protein